MDSLNVGRMSAVSFGVFPICTVGLAAVLGHHQSPILIAVYAAVWILSFVYAMYLWIAVIRYGDRRLLKRGVNGTAQVLSAKETSWQMAAGEYYGIGAPNVWKYGLGVSVPGKRSYPTSLYICARLGSGETVRVRVSRLNPKRVTVDLAEHAAARASTDPGRAATKTIAREGLPATAARWQQPAAPSPDVADELAKLADLRDRGVLTDAEFEAQKAKVLGAG